MPCLVDADLKYDAVIAGYHPPLDSAASARLAWGAKINAAERSQLPTRVDVCVRPKGSATFIYTMNVGPFIFPSIARKLLESAEPGVHEFHELEAICDGESLGSYHLWLGSPLVDCVDLDRTVFSNGRGRDYFDEVMARPHVPGGVYPSVSLSGARKLYLRREAVAGKHWWRATDEFQRRQFCSLDLRKQFEQAKVLGLSYLRCELSPAKT